MKILSLKKVTPMFTGVIVTCDRYTVEETTTDGIEDVSMTGRIKEVQTVVSPSEQCVNRGIKVGDLVALTYEKYKKVEKTSNNDFGISDIVKSKTYYEMPVMVLDGREHMLIDVSDIELKIDDYEYVEFNESLIK